MDPSQRGGLPGSAGRPTSHTPASFVFIHQRKGRIPTDWLGRAAEYLQGLEQRGDTVDEPLDEAMTRFDFWAYRTRYITIAVWFRNSGHGRRSPI
jgi:hypothetical protein